MAKDNKRAAQRAKKKNEKTQKRKAAVAKKKRNEALDAAAAAQLRATEKAAEDALRDWKPEQEGLHGLALRTRRNLYETARNLEHLIHHGQALPDYLWTTQRIAALPTDDVVAKLKEIGIDTDQARFGADSKQDISALAFWERALEPGLADTTPVRDLDFAGLAVCDLWQRWQPERPSSEMMLARLIDTDEAEHHEDFALSAEKALEMWQLLRLALPGEKTIEKLEKRLGVQWDFRLWMEQLYDYAEDVRDTRADLVKRIAEAFDQVLAEVTDVEPDLREHWLEHRADLTPGS